MKIQEMDLPNEIWIYEIFPRCELRVLYQICKDWNFFIKSYHLPQLYSEFEKPGESFVQFLIKKGRLLMSPHFYLQVGKFGGLSVYLTSRVILCPTELRYATVWFMRGAILQNDFPSITKMMKSVGNLSPFFVFDAIACGNKFLIDYFKCQDYTLNDDHYVAKIKNTETQKVINTLSCVKFGATFCLGFCGCSPMHIGSQSAQWGSTLLTKTETNAFLFYFARNQLWDDFGSLSSSFKGIDCCNVLPLIDTKLACTKELILQFAKPTPYYLVHKIFIWTCICVYKGSREDLMRLMIELYLARYEGSMILQRYLISFHYYNLRTLEKILQSYITLPNLPFREYSYPDIDQFICKELLETELGVNY